MVDDPTMTSMYWQRQESSIESMNKFVTDNMIRLLEQFKMLPLTNAKTITDNIEEQLVKLRDAMKGAKSASAPANA